MRRIPRLRLPGLRALGSGPRAAKLVLDAALLLRLLDVLERESIEVMHAHNYEAALIGLAARRLTGVAAHLPQPQRARGGAADVLPEPHGPASARVSPAPSPIARCRGAPTTASRSVASSSGFLRAPRRRRGSDRDDRARRLARGVSGLLRRGAGDDPRSLRLRRAPGAALHRATSTAIRTSSSCSRASRIVRRTVGDALLVLATHATPRDLPPHLRRLPAGVRLVTAGDFATVRDLIQVADLALCPRREWSGFPMKLLNYMAAAKAVVVSAGSAKAVRHGVNGLVVDDDRPDAYAAAHPHAAFRPGAPAPPRRPPRAARSRTSTGGSASSTRWKPPITPCCSAAPPRASRASGPAARYTRSLNPTEGASTHVSIQRSASPWETPPASARRSSSSRSPTPPSAIFASRSCSATCASLAAAAKTAGLDLALRAVERPSACAGGRRADRAATATPSPSSTITTSIPRP